MKNKGTLEEQIKKQIKSSLGFVIGFFGLNDIEDETHRGLEIQADRLTEIFFKYRSLSRQQDRETMRKEIEGMKSLPHHDFYLGEGYWDGYHTALDDVLRLLEEKE